jgi:hypothetical protein
MDLLRASNKMPLRCDWLQTLLTASSNESGLNAPPRERISAFLACGPVITAFAELKLEIDSIKRF